MTETGWRRIPRGDGGPPLWVAAWEPEIFEHAPWEARPFDALIHGASVALGPDALCAVAESVFQTRVRWVDLTGHHAGDLHDRIDRLALDAGQLGTTHATRPTTACWPGVADTREAAAFAVEHRLAEGAVALAVLVVGTAEDRAVLLAALERYAAGGGAEDGACRAESATDAREGKDMATEYEAGDKPADCALADRDCAPCRGGVETLRGEALTELAAGLDEAWRIEKEHHLARDFDCKNFARALDLVNAIGALAEAAGHHPDLTLGWGYVGVRLHTHKIDGLSEADFVLAARIDRTWTEHPDAACGTEGDGA